MGGKFSYIALLILVRYIVFCRYVACNVSTGGQGVPHESKKRYTNFKKWGLTAVNPYYRFLWGLTAFEPYNINISS